MRLHLARLKVIACFDHSAIKSFETFLWLNDISRYLYNDFLMFIMLIYIMFYPYGVIINTQLDTYISMQHLLSLF